MGKRQDTKQNDKESDASGGTASILAITKEDSEKIGSRRKKENTAGGSTLRPVYGERRPVMYHLFETEMKSVSSFNGEALRYFSFGSFLLALFLNIAVAGYFFPPPMPLAMATGEKYALFATAVLSLMCFGFGIWALCTKQSVIKQIKNETKSDAD